MAAVRRRLAGRYEIDEWGGDAELIGWVAPWLRLWTRIEAEGADRVPATGPALLVANRRFGLAEPFVVQAAVLRAAGRQARFAGIPDVAPLGMVLRRLGGVISRPAEVLGLLQTGHVVLVPLSTERSRPMRAGTVEPDLLHPAVLAAAPVLPVAVLGGELSGRWRVVVGPAVEPPRTRTGPHSPLARAELADAARAGVQELLDEATPPGPPWRA